ncbi:MAG TPA: hypothetical protein DC063_03785 [Arenimonas sp.]|nr:hypothetical protein [Arenimonas sp.]
MSKCNRSRLREATSTPPTDAERCDFLQKVAIGQATGCWEWARCLDTGGYGNAWFRGTNWRAHRVSWFLFRGSLPVDDLVLHKCDNRSCVNPEHLFLGDHSVNMADMRTKERCVEQHHNCRLTREDVLEIIRLAQGGGMTQAAIGSRFGIGDATVNNILRGRRWLHVTRGALQYRTVTGATGGSRGRRPGKTELAGQRSLFPEGGA